MLPWLKAHKRLLAAIALFLAGLLVFALFWWLDVSAARQKGKGGYLNDTADSLWLAVDEGLSQGFTAQGPFYSLGVLPRFEGEPAGTLTLELLDGDGNPLAAASAEAAGMVSEQWAVFVFEAPAQSPDGRYVLRFTAPNTPGLALAASEELPEGWSAALQDSETQTGALCVLAVTGQIGGFLTGFYWVFALLASCVAPALTLLYGRKKPLAPHLLFLAAFLGLSFLYNLILPPYAAPDEQFHINQAFDLSSFVLGEAPWEVPWGLSYRRAGDADPIIMDQHITVFTYRQLADNLFTLTEDATPTVYQHEEVGGTKLPYLFSGLGVLLGRLLGLGFVPVLYLGRLFNVLAAAALLTLAVKLAPFGKNIFMVAALLPSTLHLTTSFSRDSLLIAGAFLFIACSLRVYHQKSLTGRDMLVLAGLAVFLAPIKYVYVPVLLFPLLMPAAGFTFKGRPLAKKWAWALRGGFLLLIVLAVVLVMAPLTTRLGSLASLAQPQAAVPAAEATPQGGIPPQDSVTFRPGYILAHPGHTLRVVAATLSSQLAWYWQTLVGGSLGYFSIDISWGFVVLLTLCLAAAALPEKAQPRLGAKQTAWGALLCLAMAGLVVVACLSWTPIYYDTIYGLQGRYLLPVLPLMLLCVQSGVRKMQLTAPATGSLVCCTATASTAVLLNALLVILAR